jgi:hypothetical protein
VGDHPQTVALNAIAETMPANGAVYIQEGDVDLSDIFNNVKTDKGLLLTTTYYDVDLDGDVVRFNVIPSSEVPNHIRGFLSYISSLSEIG